MKTRPLENQTNSFGNEQKIFEMILNRRWGWLTFDGDLICDRNYQISLHIFREESSKECKESQLFNFFSKIIRFIKIARFKTPTSISSHLQRIFTQFKETSSYQAVKRKQPKDFRYILRDNYKSVSGW